VQRCIRKEMELLFVTKAESLKLRGKQ